MVSIGTRVAVATQRAPSSKSHTNANPNGYQKTRGDGARSTKQLDNTAAKERTMAVALIASNRTARSRVGGQRYGGEWGGEGYGKHRSNLFSTRVTHMLQPNNNISGSNGDSPSLQTSNHSLNQDLHA